MKIYQNTPSSAPKKDFYGPDVLRGIVEYISVPRVFESLENEKIREFIFNEFQRIFGETPRILGDTKNIVIGDLATAKIVVGAHYDSVEGTPGADDNASAVATMLRIAAHVHPKDKACFVAWNGEECGLLGSKEFVSMIPKHNKIEQVHVLEMVGYCTSEPNSQKNPLAGAFDGLPTVGNFIGVVSQDAGLIQNIATASNAVDIPIVGLSIGGFSINHIEQWFPHLLRSDHYPFWANERPISAAMWTDTAEFRNKNYHQKTDTPETLNYEFMASVGDAIIETIKGARL